MRVLRIGPIALFALTLAFLHLVAPISASAQAWLPGKGTGNVSIAYKNFYVRDHVDRNGIRADKGQIYSHVMAMDVDYGITRRLAVNVGVPFSMLKYSGNTSRRAPLPAASATQRAIFAS